MEDLASGPGKLTLALAIGPQQNGVDVTRGSLVVREPAEKRKFEIRVGPRIGISQCVERPLRFWVAGNRNVSAEPAMPASCWLLAGSAGLVRGIRTDWPWHLRQRPVKARPLCESYLMRCGGPRCEYIETGGLFTRLKFCSASRQRLHRRG